MAHSRSQNAMAVAILPGGVVHLWETGHNKALLDPSGGGAVVVFGRSILPKVQSCKGNQFRNCAVPFEYQQA